MSSAASYLHDYVVVALWRYVDIARGQVITCLMASSHYPNQRWLKQCLHKARYHSDVLLIATLQMCFIEINKVVYVSGIWLGMGLGCHYDVPAKMASAPIMPAQWDCQGGSRQESLCHCYIVPIVKILAIFVTLLCCGVSYCCRIKGSPLRAISLEAITGLPFTKSPNRENGTWHLKRYMGLETFDMSSPISCCFFRSIMTKFPNFMKVAL